MLNQEKGAVIGQRKNKREEFGRESLKCEREGQRESDDD